jgi:hypothetical protein
MASSLASVRRLADSARARALAFARGREPKSRKRGNGVRRVPTRRGRAR